MCLELGSGGYNKDTELAAKPGLRRLFTQLIQNTKTPIIKHNFLDEATAIIDLAKIGYTKKGSDSYSRYVLIGCSIDEKDDKDKTLWQACVAQYAKLRKWHISSKKAKETVEKAISKQLSSVKSVDTLDEIKTLLLANKYVVLQGAPGVGKTYHTEKIKEAINPSKTFFKQFHAETTYSDFVQGLRPNDSGAFEMKDGVLVKAIRAARKAYDDAENKEEAPKVLLVIDEINRANLSNVLGEAFYLFERGREYNDNCSEDEGVKFEASDGEDSFTINCLPPNLYVVATMNTADRSLAVVDFALRRRFVWYSMKPRFIELSSYNSEEDKEYVKACYDEISYIFMMNATDQELNLQPGGVFYMAESKETMNEKLRYEIMPLIKEYLEQGFLLSAKDEFSKFFFDRIDVRLFE